MKLYKLCFSVVKALVEKHPSAQGIAVVIARDEPSNHQAAIPSSNTGMNVDYDTVKNTFESLEFAVLDLLDPSPAQVIELVKTLSEMESYFRAYEFIVFYCIGHGGMTTGKSNMSEVLFRLSCESKDILNIFENIVNPLHYLPINKLFFFDCCLDGFHNPTPNVCLGCSNCDAFPISGGQLIAFATGGGTWTQTFCRLLVECEDECIENVWSKTKDAVNESNTYMNPIIIGGLGVVCLNKTKGNNFASYHIIILLVVNKVVSQYCYGNNTEFQQCCYQFKASI